MSSALPPAYLLLIRSLVIPSKCVRSVYGFCWLSQWWVLGWSAVGIRGGGDAGQLAEERKMLLGS